MRILGLLFLWIGGSMLLWLDMEPRFQDLRQAWQDGGMPVGLDARTWILQFARPIFVVGVLCAAGLPRKRKPRQRTGMPPASPPPPSPLPLPELPPPPTPDTASERKG